MSKCRKCNVEIMDETDKCPLCHCVLEIDEMKEENMYPNVRIGARRLRFISNVILFISIVAESVMLYTDYVIDHTIWWSLVAGLILVFSNISFHLAVLGKSDYRIKIIGLTTMSVVFLIVIDFITGYRGWSVNYILPVGIILVDIGILVFMIVNRRNWQSYMMWQILMILLSLIPLGLLIAGIISFEYLAIAAFGLSVFIFLGTVIIGDRRARTELKRRFHV